MAMEFSLEPVRLQLAAAIQELAACNRMTECYGLVLSQKQMETLVEHRFQALRETGRVEFGGGILKKLIYAFCDSPYLWQSNYESTMLELQDLFYYFKNESMEQLSDDELIEAMKDIFDGKAQGSLEYLSGTALETLCRITRGGEVEAPDEDWKDDKDV